MLVYNRIFFGDFGCGSRIYSHTNIAKNSLDLPKLLDYIGFKDHPIPN